VRQIETGVAASKDKNSVLMDSMVAAESVKAAGRQWKDFVRWKWNAATVRVRKNC
jgi:hypothetical protein